MQKETPTHRYHATPALARTIEIQGRQKKWIAEQSGVSRSLITYLVQGRKTASQEVADKIATALGSDVFVLFKSHDGDTLTLTGDNQ